MNTQLYFLASVSGSLALGCVKMCKPLFEALSNEPSNITLGLNFLRVTLFLQIRILFVEFVHSFLPRSYGLWFLKVSYRKMGKV